MIITINNLERNTADGAVITVHWNATLTDGELTASAYEAHMAEQEAEMTAE